MASVKSDFRLPICPLLSVTLDPIIKQYVVPRSESSGSDRNPKFSEQRCCEASHWRRFLWSQWKWWLISVMTENSLAGMCGELAGTHSIGSPRSVNILVNCTFLASLDSFQNSCLKFLMEIKLGKWTTFGNEWQHHTGQPCNLPRSCFYWKENDKSLVAATTIPWIQRCQKLSWRFSTVSRATTYTKERIFRIMIMRKILLNLGIQMIIWEVIFAPDKS